MIKYEDFMRYWPFEKVRESQEILLRKIAENWDRKKFILVQSPTGTGKSGIAIAISQAVKNKCIISTPQKLLQQQYMNDFETNKKVNISEMKGRNNFSCNQQDSTCADGPGSIKSSLCPECPYMKQKKLAEQTKAVIMNFAYYMTTCYGNSFKEHPTLIVDEAHNLAEQIIAFCEIKITDDMLHKIFDNMNINVPELDSLKKYEEWMKDLHDTAYLKMKKIKKLFDSFDADIESNNFSHAGIKELKIEYDRLDNFCAKINRYLGSKDKVEWIWSFEKSFNKKNEASNNYFLMKPLDIYLFADDLIFSRHEKIILMSATLLDKEQYCKTLGISTKEVEWYDVESTFPTENHQFLCHSVGKLGYSELNTTLPKLIPVIKLILEQHKGQKGIIHTNSFKISSYIKDNLKNSRLLIQESGESNQIIYDEHKVSKKDTVIVSPSMTEGIDLPGDQGEFQIIIKLPFGNLGDNWIKIKSERNPDWYLYKMILTFVQSIGRIQRNEFDKCVTYCLDPSFNFFIKVKGKNMLPNHIKKILGI